MIKLLGAVAALALLAAVGVDARAQQQQQVPAAQQGQQDQITAEDQEFLTTAIQAGLAEVQLAQLALERALAEQVRGRRRMSVSGAFSASAWAPSWASGCPPAKGALGK